MKKINRKKLLIISILILIVALCFGIMNAFADFGDFSGDSDYGGSSDSGSSWSSSDSDYGGSYYGGSSGSGSGGGLVVGVLVVVGIFVVMGVVKKGSSGGATSSAPRPAGATVVDASLLRSISDYRMRDPGFSEPALCERISNLYVQMQNCWTMKNLEPLRPYFTDASYAQFDRQLESHRLNERTNYIDRIAVLGVQLRGWYEQENNDCMVANVRTRIVDYTKDDRTGSIISGSITAEKFMTYEYIMVRSSGFVTGAQDRNAATINCPNCAAPLNINFSAKCPYCGSVVTT